MKQSEYIPGDWVKASGQLCRVEEVFVNRLTNESEYTLIYPNGNSSRIAIGEIEPVPLTPEILEKNGWEKKDDLYWKSYELVTLVVQDKILRIVDLYSNLILRSLEYVHELQHLLFGLDDNSEIKI